MIHIIIGQELITEYLTLLPYIHHPKLHGLRLINMHKNRLKQNQRDYPDDQEA